LYVSRVMVSLLSRPREMLFSVVEAMAAVCCVREAGKCVGVGVGVGRTARDSLRPGVRRL
jgi:hypothetical protein